MHFWRIATLFRFFCARTLTSVLAIALLLATLGQSQAADPEPKRVMMLHSFGLRFRPWTDYSEAFRAEMSRRASVEFQDHSLLNARRNSDKSDAPMWPARELRHRKRQEGPSGAEKPRTANPGYIEIRGGHPMSFR